MTGSRVGRLLAGLAVATGSTVAALAPVAPAVAADTACVADRVLGTDRLADLPADADNPALDRMGVAAAHQLATGRGVKVAVIDSGVQPGVGGIDRRPLFALPGSGPILSAHGTIAAGHIAGDRGVAPDAIVYDVRVYDADGADASQGQKPLTSAGLAAGIRAVIAAHPREQFDIVNISLMVGEDPVVERAVADLVALPGVVVVAAAGNASGQTSGGRGTTDSDAAVFPADYEGVVGVSAVAPPGADPRTFVLPNLDTDVAAPTLGSISYNATGQRCAQVEVATSWAAAEVSGVLALLRERYPRETPAQLVARLKATTEGAGAADVTVTDPWVGAGVVQAYDALTHELAPDPRGQLQATPVDAGADGQAPPPPPRLDLFGSSRALLLWATLAAGVLIALALMLRPLVSRRR
jgi:membrane-anchored mycosin MYCP